MIGQIVANYQIISVLGEGGMGKVYKAFDLKLQRFVAIKILNSKTSNQSYYIKRFQNEAISQAKLIHPNIVSVLGFIEENEVIGIVMEYVEGETLEDKIQNSGKINLNESLVIIKQVLNGISFAHKKGFIHRDLKPSNIIIDKSGLVKVMDFGIAKSINETKSLTKFGSNVGTILYMSPEQIKAKDLTIKTDIYSIGLTLYEMLNGEPAFNFNTEYDIMEAHLKKEVPFIMLKNKPEADFVNSLILKATSKNSDNRYNNCNELINEIDKFILNTKPFKNKNKNFRKSRKKQSKLKNLILTGSLIVVFITLLVYVVSVIQNIYKNKDENLVKSEKGNVYSGNPTYKIPTSFSKISIGDNSNINSISFIDDSTSFLCGDNGLLMKSTDSGMNWEKVKIGSAKNLNNLLFINGSKGFIVGNKGTILYTETGGENWEIINLKFKNSFSKIYFIKNSDTGFLIGSDGIILKTTDSGNSWREIYTFEKNYLFDISFINNNVGFVVGWDGLLLKTTDKGTTWNKEEKISDNYLRGISFSDNGVGIIIGSGEVFRSINSGGHWEKENLNNINGFKNILMLNNKIFFICGQKGEMLISNNSGKNWIEVQTGNYTTLNDIYLLNNKLFIVGDNGTILYGKLTLN